METNLRGSIRGVSPRQAAWRPAANRHNIWELVVHARTGRDVAWRRLTGSKCGSFPLEGSNWMVASAGGECEGRGRPKSQLPPDMHRTLRDAVAALRPADLPRKPAGRGDEPRSATGVAAHDLYHAGQIQLIKRLMPGKLIVDLMIVDG